MPCGEINQLPHHHYHHTQLQQQQRSSCGLQQPKDILNLNNLNQMMTAIPGGCGGVGAGVGVAQIHRSSPAPLHHLTVDVNLNHVVGSPSQSIRSPVSPNPLDNANLRRQSTGLSAFNDYVDLVKRHLMYAVREEVEILKQQIVEMMEQIGQLEYENSLLKSEAKPETLRKLVMPRVTQAAGGGSVGAGAGAVAVVAPGAGGAAAVAPQQQQQQPATVAPQVQNPLTPSSQQSPATMVPQQQAQTVSSGTSTPTLQQQQQQHLVHQSTTPQPGQAPMS